MKADISSWCVTFYLDERPGCRDLLRQIYLTADGMRHELGISAGSVGIFTESLEAEVVCFVTLMRCNKVDAIKVLEKAGAPLASINFEDVLLTQVGKASSISNRRKRLRDGL